MKPVLGLAALALAGFVLVQYVLPGLGGEERTPTEVERPRGLDPGLEARLERADDLTAPEILRETLEATDSRALRAELRSLREERARQAHRGLATRVEELLNAFRYQAAVGLVHRYRTAWADTGAAAGMAALIDEIRAEQRDQVEQRRTQAIELVGAGRYQAARESVRTDWELEDEFREKLDELTEEVERRIRVHAHNAGKPPPSTTTDPGVAPTTVRAEPSAPPPLPGFPHPDVKRLAEARALLKKASQLFNGRRFQHAADALGDLVGYYGDLKYVVRRREAVGAVAALARHGARGVGGLFNATRTEKRKGRRVRLTYRFESDAEYLDWEALSTVAAGGEGDTKRVPNGIQLHGVQTYLLRAWFENDVTIRAVSKPQRIQSHGLALCQAGLETRQLLWLVCNHWFTEGENYVKKRPGHSLIMIGKGVNADVPVDAPDVGFIFRGPSITEPAPPPGASFEISWSLKKDTMSGEVVYRRARGSLSGSTVGDDGRSIEKTRPGLFTVDNSVTFREIVIEGKLHPTFEQGRISELLHGATLLD